MAFTAGMKDVYKTKKPIFIFYIVQFLFAYILTKPISKLLSKAFSTSTFNDVILNRFDLRYFYLMLKEFGQGVDLFGLIIPLSVLYLIISIFLTSGIFWLFYTKSEFKFSDYIVKCINYFGRFTKLFLVSMIFYFACISIFFLLSDLISNLTEDTITEIWPVLLNYVNIVILVILVSFVLMIFEYAKIIVINENASGIFSSVFEAAKFFMMNFFKTIGIFLIYFIIGIIFLVIFNLIDSVISTNTSITIAVFFIISQVYIFMRQYLRLALYDSIIVYYQKSLTAIPGMLNKEMLEMAVVNYEKRAKESEDNS